MLHRFSVLLALAGLACSPTGSFQGALVNGLTGQPVAEVRILAKAPDAGDLTCQVLEATTAADGSFTVSGLCADQTYTLETTDKTLLIAGGDAIQGGVESAGPQVLKAWKIPGRGVYLQQGEKVELQRTAVDVKSSTLLDSEEKAWYPDPRPPGSSFIELGSADHLLLVGKDNLEELKFMPLIESGPRVFAGTPRGQSEDPWVYLGIEFASDKDYTRKEVTPDPSEVMDLKVRDQTARLIKGSALPAGEYALWSEGGRRAYALRVGGAGEQAAAE